MFCVPCCQVGHQQQKLDPQLAAANYKWALELNPNMFAALINLGNLLDTHGELAEAASCYRKAMGAAPRAALAPLNLRNTLNRMAAHKEAVAALTTAVKLEPTHWQGALNLGNSLCGLGELERVVRLYRELANLHPNNAHYAFRLSYFLLLSGDGAGAARYARAVLQTQQDGAAEYGPALWVLGIAERGGLHRPPKGEDFSSEHSEGGPGPQTGFGQLAAKLQRSEKGDGDENQMELNLYRSLRDANLLKCPEWDPAGSKEQLALNLRQLNATAAVDPSNHVSLSPLFLGTPVGENEEHAGHSIKESGIIGDFFPQTFVMPEDADLFIQAAIRAGPEAMWMQKPSGSKNGLGIKVFKGVRQPPKKRGLLIQRYVQPPFLVDGLKCNFRLYVIVTDLDPLRLYIFDDAMIYFSGERYDGIDIDNLPRHITNRGYTETPQNFPTSLEQLPDAREVDDSTRTLEAFMRYLENNLGVDASAWWARVKAVVLKTFAGFLPRLRSRWKRLVRDPLSRHFLPRVAGVDIHLDAELNPWLLEVNPNPAMASRKRIRSKVLRAVWAMITPTAGPAVKWPVRENGPPAPAPSTADADAAVAADVLRRLGSVTPDPGSSCPKGSPVVLEDEDGAGSAGPPACLPIALVQKIIVGELEWRKRGRLQRIFPADPEHDNEGRHLATPAFDQLLATKANTAAAFWHRWLRRPDTGPGPSVKEDL
eukprot:SAG31_NODE_657_length_13108_cov_3.079330_14_plen_709_part_00